MKDQGHSETLVWTGAVFSAEDLRRHLNGHRELLLAPKTILTPLALDELRQKKIALRRGEAPIASRASTGKTWSFVQDRPDPLVQAAIAALGREGILIQEWHLPTGELAELARLAGLGLQRGEWPGSVVFSSDAALVCCIANKVNAVRAAAAASAAAAARALRSLGANLLAVDSPGRTFFEIKQILKTAAAANPIVPDHLRQTLEALDAHR